MATGRIGLWLIGAKGGVATTVMTGLAAMNRGLVEPIGLITETSAFHPLNLALCRDIVIGGHDIRDESLLDEARRMWTVSRAISPDILEAVTPDLQDIETRIRPGTVLAAGRSIQAIASSPESKKSQPHAVSLIAFGKILLIFQIQMILTVLSSSTLHRPNLHGRYLFPMSLKKSHLSSNRPQTQALCLQAASTPLLLLRQMLPTSILRLLQGQHRLCSINLPKTGAYRMPVVMAKQVRHCSRVFLPQCFVIATLLSKVG